MKDKRESFNSRWGFILACIGSAVGMGNIWMFPTRVSLYGGGSFLIPYFIFVVVIASTGVIGEMSFGRAARSGPIDAYGMVYEFDHPEVMIYMIIEIVAGSCYNVILTKEPVPIDELKPYLYQSIRLIIKNHIIS